MNVKASEVKALRDKTGAGMLDCKKALIEAEGDEARAEKLLKEMGLAAADRRSGKAANEGRVFSKVTANRAALLELSCETDFVSRNDEFIQAGEKAIDIVIKKGLTGPDDELSSIIDDVKSKIKENLGLKRIKTTEIGKNELVRDYIHGEGKIGVYVKIASEKAETLEQERVKELAFDLALHVAAYNPAFLSTETVDPEYKSEQEGIFAKQAESLDKPEKVTKGIVQGKLNKHLKDVVFLEQGFVKEEKSSVSDILKKAGSEVNDTLSIVDYAYFRVGEEE